MLSLVRSDTNTDLEACSDPPQQAAPEPPKYVAPRTSHLHKIRYNRANLGYIAVYKIRNNQHPK